MHLKLGRSDHNQPGGAAQPTTTTSLAAAVPTAWGLGEDLRTYEAVWNRRFGVEEDRNRDTGSAWRPDIEVDPAALGVEKREDVINWEIVRGCIWITLTPWSS